MNKNFFEEFQAEKARLMDLAAKARRNGWIDEAREKQIIDKINNDTLTLGVIGQMKCGKSTFLNAFVFGDTVLPAASTPMTAALSVITYGPEKKIVAEFYTPDEWAEQKMQASRNLDDVRGNEMEESKIKAAQELVAKSVNIPGDINAYLGTTREDSLDNLIQYVGAEGKFVAITKSVTIYCPHEYLKGVEIVDTPGFNDPIVSREERTKEFLRRADVVLLMLYAGRAFDATDRTILFKNVRDCGIGKILIGVNKYDIPYGKEESEQEIVATVKEQIEKACAASGDESMVALVKEQDPILISAAMSLMSQLPMERVEADSNFSLLWKNACRDFEISSQVEMAEKSHINQLTDAVKDIVQRDKMEVLLKKPYNAIYGAAASLKETLESEWQQAKMLLDNLQQPDDVLEKRYRKLQKDQGKLERKIASLGDAIDTAFSDILRRGRRDMEDEVEDACRKLNGEIDRLGRMATEDDIVPKWNSTWNILRDRRLRRRAEDLESQVKSELSKCVREICEDSESILLHYTEDFDARDFLKRLKKCVSDHLDSGDVFSGHAENLEKGVVDSEGGAVSLLEEFGVVLAAGEEAIGKLVDIIGKVLVGSEDLKIKLRQEVENVRRSFNVEPMLEKLRSAKPRTIELVKQKVFDEFLTPIQNDIKEILDNKQDREKQLKDATSRLAEIEAKLNKFNADFNEAFGQKGQEQ